MINIKTISDHLKFKSGSVLADFSVIPDHIKVTYEPAKEPLKPMDIELGSGEVFVPIKAEDAVSGYNIGIHFMKVFTPAMNEVKPTPEIKEVRDKDNKITTPYQSAQPGTPEKEAVYKPVDGHSCHFFIPYEGEMSQEQSQELAITYIKENSVTKITI